ncbi:DUF6049 family protein [Isoptericola sp. S6320L]|uniref:DUF6049 family protein n=1 Tax=Isoptericola sp. S6320L TaxID=2926411 RepID=UPI001FF28AAF|nr:DUF6049 family protein [Isoptericola sp. S6320L]MCK0116013.1 DUF6049 family protein [Isoptericola sp. S6320L]
MSRAAVVLSRAVAVVVAALMLAGALVALPLAAAVPSSAAVRDGVTVDIVDMSPTVVGPDQTQDVTVRVTNDSEAALTGLQADLGVGWREVSARSTVAAWADDDSTRTAARQLSLPMDDLPAGESAEVTFELGVSTLQLGVDAPWGPRQLSVEVRDDGGTIDVLHSFMLYDPDGGTGDAGSTAPAPVDLAVVAPLTGPPLDPAAPDEYNSTIAERTSEDGAYEALLSAAGAADVPLSLAVDPAVVATAATSSDEQLSSWASRLQRPGAADVVTLPPYDTDLAALAHADVQPSGLRTVTTQTGLVPSEWTAPDTWSTRIGWPAGTADLDTLAAARSAGTQHVLVTDGLEPRIGVTASATTTVPTAAGDVAAVVADHALGGALAASTAGSGSATPAATQRLLADTAVLAMAAAESGRPVSVVAAMPRDWSPDVETYTAVTSALAGQSWVDAVALTDVLAEEPTDAPRTPLEQRVVDDAELRPGAVQTLVDELDGLASFATVAADPAALTADVDRDLVAPLAVAYRQDRDARDAAILLAGERADQLQSGIRVIGRADVLLISDTGNLPVRVRNDLPVDATVTVTLKPDDPRLIVETSPTVVVPAGESRDAEVRVRAIGSGDANLEVNVLAPSGAAVTAPTEFAVQVRAGWETVGTSVMAVGVGLLFLAGIWRTVRRGRSDRRTTAEVAETVAPQEPPTHRPPTHSPEDPQA